MSQIHKVKTELGGLFLLSYVLTYKESSFSNHAVRIIKDFIIRFIKKGSDTWILGGIGLFYCGHYLA